jgi:diguanylate cyclase (GGDEF)-like protein
MLAMVAGVSGVLWRMHDAALDDGRRALAATGTAVAEQTLRSIQSADLVLRDLHKEITDVAASGPLRADPMLTTQAFSLALRERLRNLPQIDVLSMMDPQGVVIAYSRGWPIPTISLADRDYYAYLRDHDDPATFVSAPVRNRGSNTWVFYLARRVDAPDHRFMGIVLVALPLAYFEEFFRRVTSAGGSVEVMLRDGRLLAGYPLQEDQLGRPWQPAPDWPQIAAQGGGQTAAPADRFGPARIVSVHPLSIYPVVVDVTRSEADVLASWRQTALFAASVTLAAALGFMVLFRLLAAQFRRLERQSVDIAVTAAALRRSQRLLTENAHRLETTLAQMDQGLMMVDATGRVVVCNQRAISLLDLPPELMARRPMFDEVLEHQLRTEEFRRSDIDVAKVLEEYRRSGVDAMPLVYERARPDGRILEIRSTRLQGGGIVRTYTDITARRAAEERVRYQATHDALTGLANRSLFAQRLDEAIALSERSGRGLALLYLDLDRFKQVNDTRGHQAGDKLLRAVAERLLALARASDTVARLGGDEFAVLQSLADSPAVAATLAQRLVAAIASPFDIDGVPAEIGVSIGIARYPADATSADTLLSCADRALYGAKREGRGVFCFFAQQQGV